MSNSARSDWLGGVAIVGMAGRFPKARNLQEFWNHLCNGEEAISFFTEEDVLAAGVDPELIRSPNYVKAAGMMDDLALFDAAFFGFNPREAEVTDPQQRIFLECSWEALEDADCNPETFKGRIGVYAGMGDNQYMACIPPEIRAVTDNLTIGIGNEKDYVATRVCYKANLKAPGITIQSACSTSLVTVCLAYQSLLNYQSDMALAGGVSIDLHKKGYMYTKGGILSPDGHCRAFDEKAQGTVWGSGCGVVALKRLSDALADGNRIYAVIKGAAVNNDGSAKIGFTAPGMEGQAAVVTEALEVAGVNPETITYVETHGTATSLGDPIEVGALTKAFRYYTDRTGYCRIGSVKTNIGHTDAAAGVAGLIKTTLSLHHKQIPPSLHYQKPNPQIDFENSPFFVNNELYDWNAQPGPRRAGVSSFGIGGTNAHVILEEAPPPEPSSPSRPCQLLVTSARTHSALEMISANLAEHLKSNPDLKLADVAFSLQTGRKEFEYRRALLCKDRQDAVSALEDTDPRRVMSGNPTSENQPVVFLFPGQGTQYVNMAYGLYDLEATFRDQVDHCANLLKPELGCDLREVLYPAEGRMEESANQVNQTFITQPALFVIEYALAKLWMAWGINPEAMVGHSIGEYVAACLAGVFSLEDALRLVAARGRLVQEMEPGAMLAVSMSEAQVESLLGNGLSLAAVNAPLLCVVSGGYNEIDALELRLKAKGEITRRLHTSHAFHSDMMEPAMARFREELRRVKLSPPSLPYLSNLTGTWIKAAEATDPEYWTAHLRRPVRFSAAVEELLKDTARVLLEVGPGQTLITLAKQHVDEAAQRIGVTSMRKPQEEISDQEVLLGALGRLWASGLRVNWDGLYVGEQRSLVPLPTYPFERMRYWLEKSQADPGSFTAPISGRKKSNLADWFYVPSWKRLPQPRPVEKQGTEEKKRWLIFVDDDGIGSRMAEKLRQRGHEVNSVIVGEGFTRIADHTYSIAPRNEDDYVALLKALGSLDQSPTRIAYLWSLRPGASFDEIQTFNLNGLLLLAKAIGSQGAKDQVQMAIVSMDMQEVTGEEDLQFQKALLLGPCRVIPREYSNVNCLSIDLTPFRSGEQKEQTIENLIAEFDAGSSDGVIAYRRDYRWVQCFEPIPLDQTEAVTRAREGGVYLITGGMGGIGLELAELLAQTARAKLALIGRSPFPDRPDWERWISAHGEHDEVSRKIRRLIAMEEAGATVLVLRTDVANQEQMRDAIDRVRDRFGAINGVIHSAGIPAAGVIQLKTADMIEQTLAPKVKGTMILDTLLKDEKLDFFLLCSSLASVVGVPGQVDYCAANAFLDSFAQHRARRRNGFTVSINWDAWAEVGMAVKAKDIWPLKSNGQPGLGLPYQPSDHPLFDQQLLGEDESTYVTEFSAAKQWVVGEHQIMGNPTLVGTGYLEMARAAFERHIKNPSMEISDVVFVQPLTVPGGEKKEVQTVLKRVGDAFEFVIQSKSTAANNGGEEWSPHALGKLCVAEARLPELLDLQSLTERGRLTEVDGLAEYDSDDDSTLHLQMSFSRRWNNLKSRIDLGQGEALALLELPEEYADDLQKMHLHPAVMDNAVSYILSQIVDSQDFLPFSYKKIRILVPLTRRLYSYARWKDSGESDEVVTCDVTMVNEEGVKLVEVEGCTFRKVGKQALEMLAHADTGRPATGNGKPHDRAASPDASSDLKDAIAPGEGVEVVRRILAMNLPPQVIVSARDLRYQMAHADASQTADPAASQEVPKPQKPSHPRPHINTAFVAPQSELEQTIAEIWQTVLGIDRVGVHDKFIELGGHSLLAIQVISRMRQAFQIDLPMDTVFKAPTVAELADRVVSDLVEQTDGETLGQMIAEIERLSKGES